MTFKEKMKLQIRNWRWWATLPITIATILTALAVAAVALGAYVSVLIMELVMVSIMLGFKVVCRWRNVGVKIQTAPVKFNGLLVKV
ncbi:MAG: hypothetical protein RR877_10150 [Aurantimicrobium sp.]|uniref:hypothetical protein n=1 Tax=Aurantimicrobium sp. TaxID=1930784 RepID=UPI002FC7464B